MGLPTVLNSEPFKWAIVAITAPIWLPFARALWTELNGSLRAEGGVLGRPPTARELEEMNRNLGKHESPLINVTWADFDAQQDSARKSVTRRAGGAAPTKRRGFRPGG